MSKIFPAAFILFTLLSTAHDTRISAGQSSVKINRKINYDFDDDERVIFDLVNRERDKKHLNGLKWRTDLARLARSYAEKMARENFFSHFDQQGADVVARARASKIKRWHKIGENLFVIDGGVRDLDAFIVQKWMQSAAHRANILDREFTSAGIGVAESKDGKIYVAQVFVGED